MKYLGTNPQPLTKENRSRRLFINLFDIFIVTHRFWKMIHKFSKTNGNFDRTFFNAISIQFRQNNLISMRSSCFAYDMIWEEISANHFGSQYSSFIPYLRARLFYYVNTSLFVLSVHMIISILSIICCGYKRVKLLKIPGFGTLPLSPLCDQSMVFLKIFVSIYLSFTNIFNNIIFF